MSLEKIEPSQQVALWQIAAGDEAAGMKLLRQVPAGKLDALGMVGRELEKGRFVEARSWLPKIPDAVRRDYAATAIDWEEKFHGQPDSLVRRLSQCAFGGAADEMTWNAAEIACFLQRHDLALKLLRKDQEADVIHCLRARDSKDDKIKEESLNFLQKAMEKRPSALLASLLAEAEGLDHEAFPEDEYPQIETSDPQLLMHFLGAKELRQQVLDAEQLIRLWPGQNLVMSEEILAYLESLLRQELFTGQSERWIEHLVSDGHRDLAQQVLELRAKAEGSLKLDVNRLLALDHLASFAAENGFAEFANLQRRQIDALLPLILDQKLDLQACCHLVELLRRQPEGVKKDLLPRLEAAARLSTPEFFRRLTGLELLDLEPVLARQGHFSAPTQALFHAALKEKMPELVQQLQSAERCPDHPVEILRLLKRLELGRDGFVSLIDTWSKLPNAQFHFTEGAAIRLEMVDGGPVYLRSWEEPRSAPVSGDPPRGPLASADARDCWRHLGKSPDQEVKARLEQLLASPAAVKAKEDWDNQALRAMLLILGDDSQVGHFDLETEFKDPWVQVLIPGLAKGECLCDERHERPSLATALYESVRRGGLPRARQLELLTRSWPPAIRQQALLCLVCGLRGLPAGWKL